MCLLRLAGWQLALRPAVYFTVILLFTWLILSSASNTAFITSASLSFSTVPVSVTAPSLTSTFIAQVPSALNASSTFSLISKSVETGRGGGGRRGVGHCTGAEGGCVGVMITSRGSAIAISLR